VLTSALQALTLVQAANTLGLHGGVVAARYAQPLAEQTSPAASLNYYHERRL
jgi:hypothetical protein